MKKLWRWALLVVGLAVLVWLFAWLGQRSLNSVGRQRQFRSWLDENLNADVSLLSSLRLRLNLLRDSRFYVNGLEVEHPVPTFPGKFVTLREVIARVPSYSLYRLAAGKLDLRFWELKVGLEQGESGDWSLDGFMNPLSQPDIAFPYPMPLLSGFRASFRDSEFTVRRRGLEMKLGLDLVMETSPDGRRVLLRSPRIPFTFTRIETGKSRSGVMTAKSASVLAGIVDGNIHVRPDDCEFRIEDLPVSALPFFFSRLPIENVPGVFSGLLRVYDSVDGDLWARLEGEIRDARLTAFGLPTSAPVRMDLPIGESQKERMIAIRLGPSGFGGFDLRIPLTGQGNLKHLEMHSDVVSLEDLATAFATTGGWTGWLPALQSSITWNAGKWLGFGWEGGHFQLNMSRSTSGLNLLADGTMMGGRVRAAMTPGAGRDQVATAAAEGLDPGQLAARLSKMLPEPWRATVKGEKANLTWRGSTPGSEGVPYWDFNVVLSKILIDPENSGEWWRKIFNIPLALVDALPEWGGGDPTPLREATKPEMLEIDQLSVVSDRDAELGVRIEYIAHIKGGSEIGGWMQVTPEGLAKGDLHIFGSTSLVEAATRANPDLGGVIGMLSGAGEGLHVTFTYHPEQGVEFTYPFLQDALRLRSEMDSLSESGESGE